MTPTEPRAESGLELPPPRAGTNLKIWEMSGMSWVKGGKTSRDILLWNGLDEDLYLENKSSKWGDWPSYEGKPPDRIKPHSGTACSLLNVGAGVEGHVYYRTRSGDIQLFVYVQSWNSILSKTNSQWHVYYASPTKDTWMCAYDTYGRNFWMEGGERDWANGWQVQTYESPYFGSGTHGDPALFVVNRPAVGDVSVGEPPKASYACEEYKAAYKNGLRSAHWFDGTVGSVMGAHIGSWIRGCP
ncbi:hypothetical protein ACQPZG_05045 (plasmid) [Streptomyces sp. CA-294286]|uniref:hypothetical protein n=1 Tax=Streptomyces sp. CA-294286 TaxID=3240070 RepID=UPI003D8AB31C